MAQNLKARLETDPLFRMRFRAAAFTAARQHERDHQYSK